ncbi:MAG: hypothetical protein QMC23_05800 [Rubritalea sp.]|jgi:hypothetical protein
MKIFSSCFTDVAIRISDGKAKRFKGKLNPKVLREVSLLCSDISLTRGEIWINKVGKVTFSVEIDERFHQRFRNIICG